MSPPDTKTPPSTSKTPPVVPPEHEKGPDETEGPDTPPTPPQSGKTTTVPPTTAPHVPSAPPTNSPTPRGPEAVEHIRHGREVLKRIAAIEARWDKPFEEVLLDLHDHVFGKSEDLLSPTSGPEAGYAPKKGE